MATVQNSTINLVVGFESLQLKAYYLEGILHIGYGFTYYHPNGYLFAKKFRRKELRQSDTITKDEALQELEIHLTGIEADLQKVLKVSLNQNQFDAIVSLIYNIGITRFRTSTLLSKLNSGDYAGASNQFDAFVYSAGKKNKVLVERRKVEKDLFNSNASNNYYLFIIIIAIIIYIIYRQKQ